MKKTIPPRTKFTFSLEISILDLKFSFSIENYNPDSCFSAVREEPGMKKIFSIENFIPYWKLDFFSTLPLEIEFFQKVSKRPSRQPLFETTDFFDSFSTFFGACRPRGREVLATPFQIFFSEFSRERPFDSCRWPTISQLSRLNFFNPGALWVKDA